MDKRIVHLMYVPWTGLGLYGGFRGNRWLKNRIKIFKQFVIPSLLAQTDMNFMLWCSWRPEEKNNFHVKELMNWLDYIAEFKTIHTFNGVCFWDDKYPDNIAKERLTTNLWATMGELTGKIGECDYVYMTIQPSDDCYHKHAVEALHAGFNETDAQAIGFTKGYIMNYLTKEVAEYNPKTNPPFFTIKFPRDIFINAPQHVEYTGPYKSHEYIGEKLRYKVIDERGFLVGTHGENISTHFNHPYKGVEMRGVLNDFGLLNVEPLKIRLSLRRAILRQLPHKAQRKLRYIFGEIIWQKLYEFLRN